MKRIIFLMSILSLVTSHFALAKDVVKIIGNTMTTEERIFPIDLDACKNVMKITPKGDHSVAAFSCGPFIFEEYRKSNYEILYQLISGLEWYKRKDYENGTSDTVEILLTGSDRRLSTTGFTIMGFASNSSDDQSKSRITYTKDEAIELIKELLAEKKLNNEIHTFVQYPVLNSK